MKFLFLILTTFMLLNTNWSSMVYSIFFLSLIFLLFFREEGVEELEFYSFLSENLIMLSCWIVLLMTISMMVSLEESKMSFYYLFLGISLILFLILTFMTQNLLLFYIFFELSIIPVFLLILGWGVNTERLQAGVYMFFYTLSFSLPFLMYLILLESKVNSFLISNTFFLMKLEMLGGMWWVFFSMVFMVKFPMFFVHLWLPKAHVEAPVSGSMVLAAVLLKLGGYGVIRVGMMNSMEMFKAWVIFFSFGVVGGILMSLICLRQVDLKCFVAYTSIAHMGLVISALFLMNEVFWFGGVLMMLAHGLTSSGLFYGLNLFYERFYSRSLMLLKGGIFYIPMFAFWWFMLCMGSMSSPPTLNFFSEIFMMVNLLSICSLNGILFFILMLLSGVYSIYLFVNFIHGNFQKYSYSMMMSARENLIFFCHILPLIFYLLKILL